MADSCAQYVNADDLKAAKESILHIEHVATSKDANGDHSLSVTDPIRGQNYTNTTLDGLFADIGFKPVNGSFEDGGELKNRWDVLLYKTNGSFYQWTGNLPKVVSAGSSPFNSGGTLIPGWINQTDLTLRSQLARPTGATMVSLNQGGNLQNAIGYTTPEMFGYTPGTGKTAFEAAAVAAKNMGGYVKLESMSYTLNVDADMKFVPVIGNGNTSITGLGMFLNTNLLKGINIVGQNTSKVVEGVMPALSKTGLIAVRYAADSFYVMSKNPARPEYLAIRMRSGTADGEAPWDLLREQSAFSCELVFAYESVVQGSPRATFNGAGWEDFQYTAAALGLPSGTTSGSENAYVVGSTITSGLGSYVDVLPSNDDAGRFSLSFLCTTGSAGILDVYLDKGAGLPTVNPDGTTSSTPDATILTNSTKARIRKISFISVIENARVRIVSRSNNRSYIMGANVDTPDTITPTFNYSNWGYYRKPAQLSYVINNGAADYAIRDLDKGTLVGSYHGSEAKLIEPKWVGDGVTLAFTDNKPIAAKDIKLLQKTSINGKITAVSEHTFGDGWVQKLIDLKGSMRSDTVYLGMCLPQAVNAAAGVDCFTELLYPFNLDVKTETEYAIGGCNLVVWRNPNTEARVYAYHRNFSDYNARTSPAFIKTSYGTTSYSKLYHSLQKDAENQFTHASSQIIHLYA